MKISAPFRSKTLSPTDFKTVLFRLGRVVDAMAGEHAGFGRSEWCLQGDSLEQARLYPAFDGTDPSCAALAVLKEQFRNSQDQTYVAIWIGNETMAAGVSMVCHLGMPGVLNSFAIDMRGEHGLDDFEAIAGVVIRTVQEFEPAYVEVSPAKYYARRVFDDRPGLGWMFYLSGIVTMQQVPEARALIPVHAAGKQQTGTIIVSVADTAFSIDNPEHIEIANRIEIRLVDQDLLPRYVDL
ncbi:immunity 52 family protein [Paraburkholderia bryophila]|uniref:immunity 52 family protein n=1 Tax=Paraburkholderia bryophila TaxID=420952 RepID=UPI00234B8CD3|nr:immunity 52 family protein [Paraburkholderia bryophila]WCM21303.1 immunity 52 family protein [Paraburkholderia bryophila]